MAINPSTLVTTTQTVFTKTCPAMQTEGSASAQFNTCQSILCLICEYGCTCPLSWWC